MANVQKQKCRSREQNDCEWDKADVGILLMMEIVFLMVVLKSLRAVELMTLTLKETSQTAHRVCQYHFLKLTEIQFLQNFFFHYTPLE